MLKFIGIEQLIISNAAGSMNPHILGGDLVFIKDHINLQPENPLRGVNDERLGPRFYTLGKLILGKSDAESIKDAVIDQNKKLKAFLEWIRLKELENRA